MINIRKLEAELWESADLLRQGSKLTSNQYCMPVLALLFLRYAYSKYKLVEAENATSFLWIYIWRTYPECPYRDRCLHEIVGCWPDKTCIWPDKYTSWPDNGAFVSDGSRERQFKWLRIWRVIRCIRSHVKCRLEELWKSGWLCVWAASQIQSQSS